MSLYLFCLVFAGVLLGASLFLGGLGKVNKHNKHNKLGQGCFFSANNLVRTLRSAHFWLFFLAFFGLTGAVLRSFGLIDQPIVTLFVALGLGTMMGLGIHCAASHE